MTALERYESEREKLLNAEGDTGQLWRVVFAADALAKTMEWESANV